MHDWLAWYRDGGMIMHVILLIGLAGVGVLADRYYVIIMRSKNNGRVFMERTIQLVRVGKIEEAIKQCASSTAALPDIGLLILRSRSRDESELENVADAAALTVLPRLTRRLDYLPTLTVASLLAGALGLVLRLREALSTSSRPLALGIATSLAPLALSLVIAVVLTLGRGYLASQADLLTEQIREFSARLINALIDRPDVRLGHR